MSDSDFRAVIDALSVSGPVRPRSVEPVRRVAVLGAGAVGRLLACEALAAGLEVRLHSVFGQELADLRAAGAITVRGAHLVGTYAVGDSGGGSPSRPAIELTASVDEAVAGADVVFVVTPASAHPTYAGVLAGSLQDGHLVVLVPGRFLGSLALHQELQRHHCRSSVTVAELAAAPYVASRDGATINVHGVASQVDVAALPVDESGPVAERLSALLPMLTAVDSPLVTAFGGVTGVLGVAPLLTNTSLVEGAKGGAVLLRDLVPAGLSQTLLHDLDEERLEVAFHYGVRDLPSTAGWLRAAYDVADDEASPDIATALADIEMFDEVTVGGPGGPHVTDDVPYMLVPLARSARAAGVSTPATDAVIALASCLVGTDLMAAGRHPEALGLGGVRPADARRRLKEVPEHAPRATTWWSV
jgi:opine dehydrogenase